MIVNRFVWAESSIRTWQLWPTRLLKMPNARPRPRLVGTGVSFYSPTSHSYRQSSPGSLRPKRPKANVRSTTIREEAISNHLPQPRIVLVHRHCASLDSSGWCDSHGILLKMPDIDPAALSRPTISTTPILPPKTISASAPSVQKISKQSHVPPRIDLEPLYTALKQAIGEHWGTYKDAIGLFILGTFVSRALSQAGPDNYSLSRPVEPTGAVSKN